MFTHTSLGLAALHPPTPLESRFPFDPVSGKRCIVHSSPSNGWQERGLAIRMPR